MGLFTAEQAEALSRQTVYAATLAELRFRSGTKRYWNGDTILSAGGHSWTGLRGRALIDGIPMLAQGAAENITLSLPGVDAQVLSLALAESDEAAQRVAIISLLLLNQSYQPVGVPVALFYGYMQPIRVARQTVTGEDGADQSVSLDIVNAFFNRARPPYGRYTYADQQRRHPGDKFFSFVSRSATKTVTYPDY